MFHLYDIREYEYCFVTATLLTVDYGVFACVCFRLLSWKRRKYFRIPKWFMLLTENIKSCSRLCFSFVYISSSVYHISLYVWPSRKNIVPLSSRPLCNIWHYWPRYFHHSRGSGFMAMFSNSLPCHLTLSVLNEINASLLPFLLCNVLSS